MIVELSCSTSSKCRQRPSRNTSMRLDSLNVGSSSTNQATATVSAGLNSTVRMISPPPFSSESTAGSDTSASGIFPDSPLAVRMFDSWQYEEEEEDEDEESHNYNGEYPLTGITADARLYAVIGQFERDCDDDDDSVVSMATVNLDDHEWFHREHRGGFDSSMHGSSDSWDSILEGAKQLMLLDPRETFSVHSFSAEFTA